MVNKKLIGISALSGIIALGFSPNLIAKVKDPHKVIYGEDNRIEYYQIDNQQIKNLADSTAALIKNYNLEETAHGFKLKSTSTLGEERNFCSDEPFGDQPSGAFCSGFLVSENTLVTAGHCISSQDSCEDISFVFGYHVAAPGVVRTSFNQNEVYRCKNLVAREEVSTGADWAVIELDRVVENKSSLLLRSSGIAPVDEKLFVIGYPSGLPLKFAGGAKVRSSSETHFVANLDTYGGNSGSAVFSFDSLKVQGILVRGETDYTTNNGCRVSYQCEDDSCRGEDVTNINQICNGAPDLCEVLGIQAPANNPGNQPSPSPLGPNSCQYANDGTCDDGRPGSSYSLCEPGTDEADCGVLDYSNSCQYANDGSCDDGRPGASYSLCDRGTDSNDCRPDLLENSCQYANDGTCDDGRAGASYSICDRGTDENDCRNL